MFDVIMYCNMLFSFLSKVMHNYLNGVFYVGLVDFVCKPQRNSSVEKYEWTVDILASGNFESQLKTES